MTGTFPFCRTSEAIRRLNGGDVIQNLVFNAYFKKEGDLIFVSEDNFRWEAFDQPLETFPPYHEWRSLSNLHYWEDLQGNNKKYLTITDQVVDEDHPEADKSQKRWFIGGDLL